MSFSDHGADADRLLTFEIQGELYALPIDGVLEVSDAEKLYCIPTVAPRFAEVINHHGDALPVVHRNDLLGLQEDRTDRDSRVGSPVLVISDRRSATAKMGLLVDRVVGLENGCAAASRGTDPVAERREFGGRVASVLDPCRLVERAQQLIETSVRGTA